MVEKALGLTVKKEKSHRRDLYAMLGVNKNDVHMVDGISPSDIPNPNVKMQEKMVHVLFSGQSMQDGKEIHVTQSQPHGEATKQGEENENVTASAAYEEINSTADVYNVLKGTPNQKRKHPEKDVKPTDVEMEQGKERLPNVIEKQLFAKEISGTVNSSEVEEADQECTLGALAGRKLKKREKSVPTVANKGPALQPRMEPRKSPKAGRRIVGLTI